MLAADGPAPQAAANLVLSLPAETLRQRPDVRVAEEQVTAAVARVAQADAALMPNFQIGGSLGLNALTLGALTESASVVSVLLVSVTERTREIGLRLAIGALECEVLLQFLIEAMALAALGGIISIIIAMGASIVLTGLMDLPYQFDPMINLLSFVFSAGIGVVFGYFPARRAAQMDPIEALRHE